MARPYIDPYYQVSFLRMMAFGYSTTLDQLLHPMRYEGILGKTDQERRANTRSWPI
jgi:hypothetical protein